MENRGTVGESSAEVLSTPVESYLDPGIAPQGLLREYRDAVGMTGKPAVNLKPAIRSSEDLLRSVIAEMENDAKVMGEPPTKVIDNPVGWRG